MPVSPFAAPPLRRLAALLCAGVFAAASCGRVPSAPRPNLPRRDPPPVLRIPAGVRVADVLLGGMRVAEAERVLGTLATQIDRPAQNAFTDPVTRGIVPGRNGLLLDARTTLAQALRAKPGTALTPVVSQLPPRVALRDLPAAPIYNGSRSRRAVALVVNIAWGENHLPALLAALRAGKAAASFCLVGRWAKQNPSAVQAILNSALQAGTPYSFCNHGYRDQGWATLSRAQAEASIRQADEVIAGLTGATPRYFSPHRGEWNAGVLAASRSLGHELVLWSRDTIDWQLPSADTIVRRIVPHLRPGDIILMHPTAPTVAALPRIIAGIRAAGLTPVTLDRLLSPEPLREDAAPPATPPSLGTTP